MTVDPHLRRELLKRLDFLVQRISSAKSSRLKQVLADLDVGKSDTAWPVLNQSANDLAREIAETRGIKINGEHTLAEIADHIETQHILSQRHLAMLHHVARVADPLPDPVARAFANVLELYEWHLQAGAAPDDELALRDKSTAMLRRDALDRQQRQHEDANIADLIAKLDALDKRYAEWLTQGENAPLDESRDLRVAIEDLIGEIETRGVTGRLADRLRAQREHLGVVDNWWEHLVYRLATRAYELVNDAKSAPGQIAHISHQIFQCLTAAPQHTEKLRDYVKPLADALRLRFRDLINRARSAPATVAGFGAMVEVERIIDGLSATLQPFPAAEEQRQEAATAVAELIGQRLHAYHSHLGGTPDDLDGVPPLCAIRRELGQIREVLRASAQVAQVDDLLHTADAGIGQRLEKAKQTAENAAPGIEGFRPLLGVYRALAPAAQATAGTPHAATVATISTVATREVRQRLGDVKNSIDATPHDLAGFTQLAGLMADVAPFATASAGTDFAADAESLVAAVQQGMRERVDAVLKTPLPPLASAAPALKSLIESVSAAARSLPPDSDAATLLAMPQSRAEAALQMVESVTSVIETVEKAVEQFDKGIESMNQTAGEMHALENHRLLVEQLPDGYLGPVPKSHLSPAEAEISAIRAEREAFTVELAGKREQFLRPISALKTAKLPLLGAADFDAWAGELRGHLSAAESARDAAKTALIESAERGKEINKRAKFISDSAKSVAMKLMSSFGLKSRKDANKLLAARAQLIDSISRRPTYSQVIWRLAENWAVPPLPEGLPDPRGAQVTGLTPQDGFDDRGGKAEMNIVVLGDGDAPYDAPFRPENFSLRNIEIAADGEPPVKVKSGHAQVVHVEQSHTGRVGPIVVALAMDCSGSLQSADPENKRIDAAQSLVHDLLKNPNVRLGLFTFHGGEFAQNHAFSRDVGSINAAVEGVREIVKGKTPLWYSIVNACHDLAQFGEDTRRVLVLFTDGKNETKITTTFEEARQAAIGAGVQVFCVGLGRKFDAKQVNQLCRVTRGTFARGTSEGLKNLFAAIARAVVNSLTLTIDWPLQISPASGGGLAGRTLEIGGELVIHPRPGVVVPSRFALQTGF